MKFFVSFIKVLLVVSSITACAKKIEEASKDPTFPATDNGLLVSGKTAAGFTVTWLPATDDSTSVTDIQYKAVYSTSNNIADAETAEANGTLALAWTANTLTATISSLTNSTKYYFTVLAKHTDNNIGVASTSVLTLCAGKRAFLATHTDGNLGGKVGADAKCNAQKPAGVGASKAMLSDNTGIASHIPNSNSRQACYGNCNNVNTYTMDWVFAGNQRYCTSDYSQKFADVASGSVMPVTNGTAILAAVSTLTYAGFDIYMSNSTTNCHEWSSASSNDQFIGGDASGSSGNGDRGLISTNGVFVSCDTPASIICIEQ